MNPADPSCWCLESDYRGDLGTYSEPDAAKIEHHLRSFGADRSFCGLAYNDAHELLVVSCIGEPDRRIVEVMSDAHYVLARKSDDTAPVTVDANMGDVLDVQANEVFSCDECVDIFLTFFRTLQVPEQYLLQRNKSYLTTVPGKED